MQLSSHLKKILILSHKGDYHAAAVSWALAHLDIEATIWCLADLPDYGTISILFEDGGVRTTLTNRSLQIALDDFGFVWNRRIEKPAAPPASHPDDIDVIEKQNLHFINAFRGTASIAIPTTNPVIFQDQANFKSVQLEKALEAGLNVKPTIISNNFDDVVLFQRRHGAVIHKPLKFHGWREEGRVFGAYTAATPGLTEEDRFSVEAVPLIYQTLVDAAYEVRLVCFGDHFVACGFKDRSGDRNVDLRKSLHEHAVEYFDVEVPEGTLANCRKYMRSMGLSYGAFDFLIDQEGAWWFLECNESGQFLYLEAVRPQVPALRTFCFWISEVIGAAIDRTDPRLAALSITAFEDAGGRDLARKMTEHNKQVNVPLAAQS